MKLRDFLFLVAGAIAIAIAPAAFAKDTNFVDERGLQWETVAASQTDQVLGTTGAAGDYLERLIITVNTAATAAVSIEDASGTNFTIMPNSPGGGVGVYVVELNMISEIGAWEVTTGAGSTVVAVGRFK